ncbi:MAG: cupin domain-containing protein, partial [Planctomycetota bacterium]
EGAETARVAAGEVLVVPAGMRHRPRTEDGQEVTMLVIDPMDVKHTGDVDDELTVAEYPTI